jgi:uncharacterized protein (TIGR02996 family)
MSNSEELRVRDALIAAVRSNPLDDTTRGICADALEESGYNQPDVLSFLHGYDVPEEKRHAVRTDLHALFGSAATHFVPETWYLEPLHAFADTLRNRQADGVTQLLEYTHARLAVNRIARNNPNYRPLREQFVDLTVAFADAELSRLRATIQDPASTHIAQMLASTLVRNGISRVPRRSPDYQRLQGEFRELMTAHTGLRHADLRAAIDNAQTPLAQLEHILAHARIAMSSISGREATRQRLQRELVELTLAVANRGLEHLRDAIGNPATTALQRQMMCMYVSLAVSRIPANHPAREGVRQELGALRAAIGEQ